MSLLRCAASSALSLLCACFSATGEGGSGPSSSQRANTLDAAQARALCNELVPMLDQSRDRGICTVSATMQAPDDPAMCQQLVDQCNILRPAQDSDCGELTVEALETCSDDISVRDLRACIGELIDWFDSADCQSDRDAPPACTMTLDNACPGSDGDAFNQPPQPNLVGTACAAGDTSVVGCPATPNTMCGMAGGTVTRVCHLPGLQPSLQPPPQPPPQGIWSACCCAQGGTLFCPQ